MNRLFFLGILSLFLIDTFVVIINALLKLLFSLTDVEYYFIIFSSLLVYVIFIYLFTKLLKWPNFFENYLKAWVIILVFIFRVLILNVDNLSIVSASSSLNAEKLGIIFSVEKFSYVTFYFILIIIAFLKYKKSFTPPNSPRL